MTITELRAKSPKEIAEYIDTQKQKLFELRFKTVTGELQSSHEIIVSKRNIARALTVLNQMGYSKYQANHANKDAMIKSKRGSK